MPLRPLRPCNHTGCPTLTRTGYCDAHPKPEPRSGWLRAPERRGSTTSRGYGWAWQKKRTAVLVRDQYRCQACKRNGLAVQATDVDHRIPKAEGGTDEDNNLESLCEDCHNAKTAKESRRGQRRRGGGG